jgi:S-formylglutathione hydrolase FrmB
MDVSLGELPGGHSWPMAVDALAGSLPWLSARTELLHPATKAAPSLTEAR